MITLVGAIVIGLTGLMIKPPQSSARPNILLIMSDDQGWGDAGYQDHPELKTPYLDSLAADGLVFNRFYAAAPVCSPTRGSMLTGRHPYRYGIYYANVGHLPKEEVTLPELLREQGYRTGHFGKWHLGLMDSLVVESNRGGIAKNQQHYAPPWEHGYDQCFATESKVPTWNPMVNPPHTVAGANKKQSEGDSFGTYYWTGPGRLATNNLTGDDSRVIMDRVIPFVEQAVREDTPFFATIWFHTPHSPVVAGEAYRQPYTHLPSEKQHYYGSLTAMDKQIGRLREVLRQAGVAEHTLIWFCSDNGPAAGGGGPGWQTGGRQQGLTGGLKGRKGSLYEGGIRVPGVVVWPAAIPAGQSTEVPVTTSDILPTLGELLGIDLSSLHLDGESMKDLLTKNAEQPRKKAIGFQSRFEGNEHQVWMGNRYKLHRTVNSDSLWLTDLVRDPQESKNLALERPELADEMSQALARWIERCKDDR
ncbi:sulfatase family protein [Tunicatimonas pelagia]|uniref:sulfatase family protein n=1 Tax=Tunicatimonas pelagia TaxID=931531 RepID=UPI002665C0D4|nr:sulfatase-like hydrolase/transferase [Tunicatimonas pelagia]WKN45004.1 sulfatase-like hydrolase/transferase [Tunicatimonas pelagia]